MDDLSLEYKPSQRAWYEHVSQAFFFEFVFDQLVYCSHAFQAKGRHATSTAH